MLLSSQKKTQVWDMSRVTSPKNEPSDFDLFILRHKVLLLDADLWSDYSDLD